MSMRHGLSGLGREVTIMGFLDSLVKKGIKNTVSDVSRRASNAAGNAIGNAVEDAVTDGFNKLFGTSGRPASEPGKSSTAASSSQASYEESAASDRQLNVVKLKVAHRESFALDDSAVASTVADRGSAAYFEDLITINLPGATVKTNVPLSEVSSENFNKQAKIDVLVSVNGAYKLAIFLPSKNQYKTHAYLNSMNACEAAGVPAIRFMKEFRNDPNYVMGRVKLFALR